MLEMYILFVREMTVMRNDCYTLITAEKNTLQKEEFQSQFLKRVNF